MDWLTVPQAAKRLRRGEDLVRRWLREGRLVGKQVGRGKGSTWLITERDLARFKRNQPERRKRRT